MVITVSLVNIKINLAYSKIDKHKAYQAKLLVLNSDQSRRLILKAQNSHLVEIRHSAKCKL